MAELKIDDRYTEGVYYDGTVGKFYECESSDDGTAVELVRPDTGECVENLDAEEFQNIQQDLFPVPEDALNDPVAYMEKFINRNRTHGDFDVGLIYSDRMTEVVEVGE